MFLLKPLRLIFRALSEDNTPAQMALGFALGLMIGLVPKGNLIAVSLMIILGVLRVNLGVGMLTAFFVSWISPFFDFVTHSIGQMILSIESLSPFWTDLYNMPIVPWTKFNNTVVMGSFALGAALLVPSFLISRPIFAKYAPDWTERLQKWRVWQLIFGSELAGKLS